MPKVWGMHMIALRPGVKGEDFERFFKAEAAKLPFPEGWKWHLLKGERGERVGRYMVLFEIDSIEARDRYSPAEDVASPEFQRFIEAHPEMTSAFEKWKTLAHAPGSGTIFTDYVEIN